MRVEKIAIREKEPQKSESQAPSSLPPRWAPTSGRGGRGPHTKQTAKGERPPLSPSLSLGQLPVINIDDDSSAAAEEDEKLKGKVSRLFAVHQANIIPLTLKTINDKK